MLTNYYEVLQLGPNASAQQVAEQYKKLALRYHPQNSKESQTVAKQMFNAVAEAYEVLSDSQKRQRYDQFGHQGVVSNSFAFFIDVPPFTI